MRMTFVGISLVTVMAIIGCSQNVTADPGVVRCQRIAVNMNAPEEPDPATPTQTDIGSLRDDFDNSKFDDLRAAGLNYADAADALLYPTGDSQGDIFEVIGRQGMLASACERHGVVLPPAIPTMSMLAN